MSFETPQPVHEKMADEIMLSASDRSWDRMSRLNDTVRVVQALRGTEMPKGLGEEPADPRFLRNALVIGLANGWDEGPAEEFAAKLGGMRAIMKTDAYMLEQTSLRDRQPGRVDYPTLLEMDLQPDNVETRKMVDQDLDEKLINKQWQHDRRATSEGRMQDASPTRQDEIWNKVVVAKRPMQGAIRAVMALRADLDMAETQERYTNPLPVFEKRMVEAAKLAITTTATMLEMKQAPATMTRSEMESSAMLNATSFSEEDERLYNTAIMQRTGMENLPPALKSASAESSQQNLQREFARSGIKMFPVEDHEWRAEAMIKARRELQLEGVPPHLQPEEGRLKENAPLSMESTYDQRTLEDRLKRAASELGITRSMMSTPGELAPLARVLHLHAPQALAIALTSGIVKDKSQPIAKDALQADTLEHMMKGDFDQARYDLARAKGPATWMAPHCSQSTKEMLGLMRNDGNSQIEALFVEAERRVGPSERDRRLEMGTRMAVAAAIQGRGAA